MSDADFDARDHASATSRPHDIQPIQTLHDAKTKEGHNAEECGVRRSAS